MTTINNPYDSLYANLKAGFTFTEDGYECTLGEAMLIKAGTLDESASSTTALARVAPRQGTISSIVRYVNAHLAVADAPARNKTIRRFPYRTSMSAIFSAVAACALVFSFGIFALKGGSMLMPYTAGRPETEIVEVTDTTITTDEVQVEK